MALRPDRNIVQGDTEVSYFMNETGERGIVVVHSSPSVSGAGMDSSGNVVAIPTGSDNGRPAGVLLNDQVNDNLTKTHRNWHKDTMQVYGKCTVATRGWVVTDQIASTASLVIGQAVYYGADGKIDSSGGHVVGVCRSTKDADGFAKIEINMVAPTP